MLDSKSIQSVSFSGHESFPLRFSWLTKIVRGIEQDPGLFGRPDAIVTLGVGKNMVRSMRHWALRCGVIESTGKIQKGGSYHPTELGRTIFGEIGLDPYLEDPSTVWLIHWKLCSGLNTSPTTWYWIFNELRETSFSARDVVADLMRFAERLAAGKTPSRGTVERDIACFVRSYIPMEPDRRLSKEETYDSPLTELALLRREPETGLIVLERGSRPTLSDYIFAYALCDYWKRTACDSDTLSFEEVTYRPGSPGQVFQLTENAVVKVLGDLHDCTNDCIGFDSTAGVRQLIRHKRIPEPLEILTAHYECSNFKETVNAK